MASISITIEDMPGGKVRIVAHPSFEEMARMINSGEKATSAHGYALRMLREARNISKGKHNMKVLLPPVRRITPS